MYSLALLATKNNSQVGPGFLNKAEHEEKTLCHFGVSKTSLLSRSLIFIPSSVAYAVRSLFTG